MEPPRTTHDSWRQSLTVGSHESCVGSAKERSQEGNQGPGGSFARALEERTRIIQVLSTSSRLHGQPWDQRSPKRRDLWADRGNKKWTRTWDSKRRLYGCQVSQGQVSHKTLGTLHLACHESLLLESHARSSISFMVGPLDGRVVRPWGTSSRHLVGAPPWGTRVPEGDCWHGGQGFLDHGISFLVTTYLSGGSLSTLERKRVYPPDR